jgi:hypothetical protein
MARWLSVRLPDEVRKQVDVVTAELGVSVQEWVTELVTAACVSRREKASERAKSGGARPSPKRRSSIVEAPSGPVLPATEAKQPVQAKVEQRMTEAVAAAEQAVAGDAGVLDRVAEASRLCLRPCGALVGQLCRRPAGHSGGCKAQP